ncbi:gp53-like domain-containing protein [Escherichia coli]
MDETNKKAPLNSPALTGTPTTPTAPQGTNSTQIASTAFVMAAIAALVDSSPDALNTLNELAAALGNDPNFATTMLNALAGKQPLDNTLTNLSGKDVAGLLTYLGLGEGAKLNAATATLGRTGFIAIPVMIGGIEQSVIIQWGWNAAKASASGGDGNTVVFPVAFNNACVAVVANYDNVSAPINAVATGGYTTTSFLLRCAAQTGSYYYNWIAIGY